MYVKHGKQRPAILLSVVSGQAEDMFSKLLIVVELIFLYVS